MGLGLGLVPPSAGQGRPGRQGAERHPCLQRPYAARRLGRTGQGPARPLVAAAAPAVLGAQLGGSGLLGPAGLGWAVSPLPPGLRRSAVPRCRRWRLGMLGPAAPRPSLLAHHSTTRRVRPGAAEEPQQRELLPGISCCTAVLCCAGGARSGAPGRPLCAPSCSAPSGAMEERVRDGLCGPVFGCS